MEKQEHQLILKARCFSERSNLISTDRSMKPSMEPEQVMALAPMLKKSAARARTPKWQASACNVSSSLMRHLVQQPDLQFSKIIGLHSEGCSLKAAQCTGDTLWRVPSR
jgi:hypothetical protein